MTWGYDGNVYHLTRQEYHAALDRAFERGREAERLRIGRIAIQGHEHRWIPAAGYWFCNVWPCDERKEEGK